MRVPVVTFVLCLAPVLASSQSLGDAARKQERERAARPAPPKVYTDEDLRPKDDPAVEEDSPAPVVADDEASPAVERDAAGAPAETKDELRARLDREAGERKRRESSWKNRARAARARLEVARREHEVACGPGVLVLTGG